MTTYTLTITLVDSSDIDIAIQALADSDLGSGALDTISVAVML